MTIKEEIEQLKKKLELLEKKLEFRQNKCQHNWLDFNGTMRYKMCLKCGQTEFLDQRKVVN